jgi:ABC-type lipoprotein release transport system permease subunit
LDVKYTLDGAEYKIKWKNDTETTWEPKIHIKHSLAWKNWQQENKAFVTVKDMQKELPLPKLNPQPSDYYRKVKN